MADPSHSAPLRGGQPDHGSWSGNLGQRKSRAGPGSAAGQGAGGPGDSQSPQQVTRQFGSDGDHGSWSGNLGQRKSRAGPGSAAGQGSWGPGGSQSPQQVTRQFGSDGGTGNGSGKASTSTNSSSEKPTIHFIFGSKRCHTDVSPLNHMQWKHLVNEKNMLDTLSVIHSAQYRKDDNTIIFTREGSQGDLHQWANDIMAELKTLSSKICSIELVMDCVYLKDFSHQWNEEYGNKTNLVTCFCERRSPKSTFVILSDKTSVLQKAKEKGNAILDDLQGKSLSFFEAERESLFVERETNLGEIDEAAAGRLHDSWPELAKDPRQQDECCIATFDADKEWVPPATSKRMPDHKQINQNDHVVQTLSLSKGHFKCLMKCTEKMSALKEDIEKNGGSLAFQPAGNDDENWQLSVTGSPATVSAAFCKLDQLQNEIHLVDGSDAVVTCLELEEKGKAFNSRSEEKYECRIGLADLAGGTTVSLQRGPLQAEGMDLVAFPVPVETDNVDRFTQISKECTKFLTDVKGRFPHEFEKLRKGKEKILPVTATKDLPYKKAALMAVPCKWYDGKKGEQDFVRSAVTELMEMTMREECSSVALEIPSYLPENAAEIQILLGLREFFEKKARKAASPTGIKTVKLFTRRQTDSTDPSQLLENAFAGLSDSAQRKTVTTADKKQTEGAAHELPKDVSARFPYFKKKVCASEKSIFAEAEGIMKKLVGCSISTNKGKLYLHCPTEKEERALALCQRFEELVRTAESGVSSLASLTISTSEYDEALVNAGRKFFPEMFLRVKETKTENGKVVLTPALSPEDQNRISGLQLSEVHVKDGETGKANTIGSAFLKDADIYVQYLPSKKVVVVVVRRYDLLEKVTSKIKVHLGQMKTAVRGKREFTTQPGRSDLDAEGASATAEFEAPEEAVKEVTNGDKKITLPGGLVVIPYRADITKLRVDAIVNAANERLAHGGGVARAIADAAGPELDQECQDYILLNGPVPVSQICVTGPGRLPCNRVIHAVGPRWDSRTPEVCRQKLCDTVLNCCREADKWELSEIAMPPTSSGIFGMPQDQCTEMYCKALLDFDQQPNKKLKTVHFVDIKDDMPLALLKALRKEIGQGQQRTRPSEADVDLSQGCVICAEKDFDQPVKLNGCNHVFCKDCIEKWFQTKPTCPSCNKVCGIITGTMPQGKIIVFYEKYTHLRGYESCGCIVIHYSFSDGYQKAEHPNPGQPYRGTRRTAYLPDNAEGNKVLRLLQEAWDRGLTFTIGRSTTTGRENVVTWNDIHHKTSTVPGHPFGYPDPDYLTRVQEELAAHGVTEESIKLAQSGNPQDFSQFYTPLRPPRSTCR